MIQYQITSTGFFKIVLKNYKIEASLKSIGWYKREAGTMSLGELDHRPKMLSDDILSPGIRES